MYTIAYIDPGTTGLIAQFAAAGFAGMLAYLRARFKRSKLEGLPPADLEAIDDRS